MQGNGKSDGVKAWSTTSPRVKNGLPIREFDRGRQALI
jgi:hypothetical protein